jgi:hypothetical protein
MRGWLAVMARVWVPLAAFRHQALPSVCAKTGAPAERLVPLRARRPGRSAWLLLLAGVVPYLVVRQFATREVTILVPFSAAAARRRARARLVVAVAAGGCPVALLLAVADGRRPALLAGAAWLAGALAAAALAAAVSVGTRLDLSAGGVLLRGVHPGFRDAVGVPGAGPVRPAGRRRALRSSAGSRRRSARPPRPGRPRPGWPR